YNGIGIRIKIERQGRDAFGKFGRVRFRDSDVFGIAGLYDLQRKRFWRIRKIYQQTFNMSSAFRILYHLFDIVVFCPRPQNVTIRYDESAADVKSGSDEIVFDRTAAAVRCEK